MFSACSFPVLAIAISVTECIDKIIGLQELADLCFSMFALGFQLPEVSKQFLMVPSSIVLFVVVNQNNKRFNYIQQLSHILGNAERKTLISYLSSWKFGKKHFFEMQKDLQSKAKLRRCVCRVRTLWVEKVWAQPDLSRYRIAPKGCCLREVGRFTSRQIGKQVGRLFGQVMSQVSRIAKGGRQVFFWSGGKDLIIAFRKYMTSRGVRTLSNGPETPRKSEGVSLTNSDGLTYLHGQVREMLVHLKTHLLSSNL